MRTVPPCFCTMPRLTHRPSPVPRSPFMTTKGERGTGLGLWVSLGIVQKHGGTVRISNSTEGDLRGAVVRVYLPERSAQAKADEEDHDAPLIAPPFESAEEWAV